MKESKSDSLTDKYSSEVHERVENYIETFNINELITDMLNTLFHELPSDPVSFMVKYLINIRPVDVMENQGMIVTSRLKATLPKNICGVAFPQLEKKCSNLFKSVLSPEVFHKIKDLKTQPYLNSVRPIFKMALENQNQKTGLFATDHDCYYTYDAIFRPILKISNYGLEARPHYIYKRFFESFDRNDEQSPRYSALLSDFKVKIRRNLSGIPFNNVLSDEKRGELVNKLLFSLLNTHGFNSSYNLAYLDDESKRNLCNSIQSITNEKKNLNRSGTRFKEWPKSRVIAKSADLKTLVWINKEDHLEIYYLSPNVKSLKEALNCPLELAQKLDRRFNFSFDEKLGFFTVKPSYLGLGIKISLKIQLNSSQLFYFKINLPAFYEKFPHFEVRELVPEGSWWELILRKRAWISMSELFDKLHGALELLFDGITFRAGKEEFLDPMDAKNHGVSQSDEKLEECVESVEKGESLEHPAEKEGNENKEKQTISNIQEPVTQFGTSWRYCVKHGLILDQYVYEIFSEEIRKHFKVKQLKLYDVKSLFYLKTKLEASFQRRQAQSFDLKNFIAENGKTNYLIATHGIVKSAYYLLRRNQHKVVFKPIMTEEIIERQTDSFVQSKEKLEKTKFIEGKMFRHGDSEFHSTIKTISDRLNLYTYSDEYRRMSSVETMAPPSDLPWGSAYYRSNDEKIFVLLNFQDHLTTAIRISSFDLMDSIERLIEMEKLVKENMTEEGFAFDSKFGYCTTDPAFSGYGLSFNVATDINREKFSKIESLFSSDGWKITENEDGSLIFSLENVESPENLEFFCKRISDLLHEIKKQKAEEYITLTGGISFSKPGLEKKYFDTRGQNEISLLDCFSDNDLSLMAFDSSCFVDFSDLYRDYTELVNINEEKLRQSKSLDLTAEKNMEHVKRGGIEDFKFKFEVGRNFEGFKFRSLMSEKAKKALVEKVVDFAVIYFGDVDILREEMIDCSMKKAQRPVEISKYFTPISQSVVIIPKRDQGLAIWCLCEDHIRIVGNADASNHSSMLYVAMDFLHELEKEKKLVPYYNEAFGFLSERAKYLGSNFRYEIKFKTNPKTYEEIKDLIQDERLITATKNLQSSEAPIGIKIKSNKVALLNGHIALINKLVNPEFNLTKI